MNKRVYTALVAFAFTACAGGGTLPGPGAVSPISAQAKAVLVIAVPSNSGAARARRPQYVSPSTQSLTVAVNGAAPSVTANVTPGSSGCTASSSGTTCDVSVEAPPGQDTFTVTLYSGTNATGSMLGTGTVTAGVSTESNTPVNITLDGIVASVSIALANPAPPAGTPATVALTITAKDASGATIIPPGSFSPAITLTDSDTSGHTHLSATTVSDPGASVTLSYDGSAAVTSATISAATGGSITGVTPATFTPATATPSASPSPTPTPTPTPTPAPMIVSPSTLNFTVANASSSINVSESGYNRTFSESDTCNPQAGTIATVTPASANGPSSAFTVTSIGAGQCTVTITDQNNQSAQVTVNVTITQGTIQ